ncbi:response regulator [Dyadobacter psychrophilus]|uniref:Response regulator receiver domain-containing protein n=1 Tax=Dyadobacter psychrophilus TaxID=651661 RepID=A0A1T5HJQ4_9BACT|nr:response regulator [Dyadobacter psychrophilus]SKC20923.1 Response regulator receiver domain-containing protein [Dyadobacter psychrophilus]
MGNKALFVLIDDDTDDYEIFKMAISDVNKPLQSLYFPDCESALAHFSQQSVTAPGYVFVDINLPKTSGEECLQQLQRLKAFDDPCIVMYSSSIPEEYKPRLKKIGVNKFIEKTGSIPLLVDEIQHLMLAG